MKSFCQLVDPLYNGITGNAAMDAIRFGWIDGMGIEQKKHDDGETYYWQIVSNSILLNCKYGELIIFVPYRSQLEEIRELTQNYSGDQNPIAWINFAGDKSLPYLPDDGYYTNINIIRFEIPQSDKDSLTERVKEAGKLLIPTLTPAEK